MKYQHSQNVILMDKANMTFCKGFYLIKVPLIIFEFKYLQVTDIGFLCKDSEEYYQKNLQKP